MKKLFFMIVLFVLMLTPFFEVLAQVQNEPDPYENTFIKADFPQWAKDMRRFDIIAFGSYPLAYFFTNIAFDTYRWNQTNGMDFSEEGRRYAPWPLKTAGYVEPTAEEFRRNVLIAAGVALTIATIDLLIFKLKQNSQRRKVESLPPSGTYVIEKVGSGESKTEEDTENDSGESQGQTKVLE